MSTDDWIGLVAETARDWQDPDYAPREEAVRATLEVDNRFTQEGLAFALNHRMEQLSGAELERWMGDVESGDSRDVAVLAAASPPLSGLAEAVAALALGHRVWFASSEASPDLVPAFFDDVLDRVKAEPIRFVPRGAALDRADALVATLPEDEAVSIETAAERAGIGAEQRCIYTPGLAMAVIDGREDAEAKSGLAEDLLLHEGESPRNPAVLWAPDDMNPDPILDTLAGFREVYPAHADTDGSLAMPTAFLASAGQGRATGPGFLVSRGDPDPQAGAHIRWSEYATLDDVRAWIEAHPVEFVVATPSLAEQLDVSVSVVAPGDAHRPALGADAPGVVAFLSGL